MLLLSPTVAGGWVVKYLDLSEFGLAFIISEGRGLCLARGISCTYLQSGDRNRNGLINW